MFDKVPIHQPSVRGAHAKRYMVKNGIALTTALLMGGCGVTYCEGDSQVSPDGECSSHLVQDVSTDGTYAIVECRDWHTSPDVDWNAVILKGVGHSLETKWLRNQVVEVVVPSDAVIKQQQSMLKGSSRLVQVVLRKASSAELIAGCGVGQ